jgi:hypothetical protein
MRTIKTYSKRAPFYNAFIVTYLVRLLTSGLLARIDFRFARDSGVTRRLAVASCKRDLYVPKRERHRAVC